MASHPLIPAFYVNNFARDVSSPYTNLDAYSRGLIDQQGNFLKPESEVDAYEYFVIKLKKIFDQLPSGMTKSALQSYLATFQMFSEEMSWYGIDKDHITLFLEGYIAAETQGKVSYVELLEDMGSGGGGAGSIGVPAAGGNVNQGGISGFDPVMGSMQRRKNPPSFLDTCEMFEVCPEEFIGFRLAKAWRQVPPSPTKNYLQRFNRRNPNGKIAIKNSDTNEVHWINYS